MAWPISSTNVRDELKSLATPTIKEEDLAKYAAIAVEHVERKLGPCTGQTVTVSVDGPATAVILPGTMTEITSVAVGGSPFSAYTPDLAARIVFGPFPGGRIVVTATAVDTVSATTEAAAAIAAAHLYRRKHLSGGAKTGGEPQGFAWPAAAEEMLSDDPMMLHGFA